MASAWRLVILLVVVSSLASVHGVRAQVAGGMAVATDLGLVSLPTISGGGHIAWTLTGDEARLLRTKVLNLFDASPTVPHGFVFGDLPTGATAATVANGLIDLDEAGAFLDYLEVELEGQYRGNEGTAFRFTQLRAADREARGLPADQSTSGLVGTTAASAEDLVIRFLYEVAPGPADGAFPQADAAFAHALHRVFSFDARDDLGSCAGACYPFPRINGWTVVTAPSTVPYTGRFLWFGTPGAVPWTDVGAYSDGAGNATFYSVDGVNAVPVDLRFATSARLSFEHTGSVAPGDGLLVQVSGDGATWENLTAARDRDGSPFLDDIPIEDLATAEFDLSAWIGTRSYVRLLFASDASGADGYGHFLRDIQIDAPSEYTGSIAFRHVDLVVGFLSFSDFETSVAKADLVRTPVGEILLYSAAYPADDVPSDRARYATFDVLENPQILFVLLVASAKLVRYGERRAYDRFRRAHADTWRSAAARSAWLRRGGLAVMAGLVVLYLFPTAFGPYVGGLTMWVACVGAVVGYGSVSALWYARRGRALPTEPSLGLGELPGGAIRAPVALPPDVTSRMICATCDADIEGPADAYRCACGETFHMEHAARLDACPTCGRTVAVLAPPETRMTLPCPACGEVQAVEVEADLSLTACRTCGSVLGKIAAGRRYLLLSDQPDVAYAWFGRVVRGGAPGLTLSSTFPERVKRQHRLPDAEMYWISNGEPSSRTLDPRLMDSRILQIASSFARTRSGAAILVDGVEDLAAVHGLDRVVRFLRKVVDVARAHEATLFVAAPPDLAADALVQLHDEFEVLEAPPFLVRAEAL